MVSLIVGGTSGLGLEIAKKLRDSGDEVHVTGRRETVEQGLQFHYLEINLDPNLPGIIASLVRKLPSVDRLFYAAGYYQEGTITDLSNDDIQHMIAVGLEAPVWFVRELLLHNGKIAEFVAITSSSQWTPRLQEPIYTATKASLGQLANSLSLDKRIEKTLVVAPAGMKTNFWHGSGQNMEKYNNADWVAGETIEALKPDFMYAFVKILRDPPRREIAELRT